MCVDFREGAGGRRRERNKHWSVASHVHLTRDGTRELAVYKTTRQPVEPHQPGLHFFSFLFFTLLN